MERADSAEIEVVRVLRPPSDTLRLQDPLVRIGSAGIGGNLRETFELLTDLVVLPADRIVLVDNRGARVAVFDSAGEWLRDIGRRGEGPGEYTGPLHASVLADTVFVWDALQRRLSRFADDGSFLGSTIFPEWTARSPFAAVPGAYVREVETGQLADPAPARGALIRTSRSGERPDTLVGPYVVPEWGWEVTEPTTGSGRMVNPPALAIYPPWSAIGTAVVRLDPLAATVEVRSLATGRLERLIRLPYAAVPPTDADREAYFQGIQDAFGLPDEALVAARQSTRFPERRPRVADLIVDDRGRPWVAEHDPGAPNYVGAGWDVLDLERGSAVHLRFPSGFRAMAVHAHRVYGFRTLESGIQVVEVYGLPASGG